MQSAWVRELPGLFRGLWTLAKPFHQWLVVILAINGAIAFLETYMYLGTATIQDALDRRAPYGDFIQALVWPNAGLILLMLLLTFVRTRVSTWFVQPYFVWNVGERCLARHVHGTTTGSVVEGQRAPAMQNGRKAAYEIIDTLFRDPTFAVRGAIILGSMFLTRPLVALFITAGLLVQFVLTSIMDWHMKPIYKEQNECENALFGLEYKVLDENQTSAMLEKYADHGYAYMASTSRAAWLNQLFLSARDLIKQVMPFGVMILLVHDVLHGTWNVGTFMFWVSYYLRGGDPVNVFFDIQQQLMSRRMQIQRLGDLAGIDFGLRDE